MDIPLEKFEGWLIAKGLSRKTRQQYVYYFKRFFYDRFNQQTVSDYLSKPSNSSKPSRAFIKNLKDYLRVNADELGILEEQLKEINAVELPKLSGTLKKRELRVIPVEHIGLLERAMPSEKLKLQLLLTFCCGLRLEEMMKIRIIDINFKVWSANKEEGGILTVIGKGNIERQIPVPSFLMRRLDSYSKVIFTKNDYSQEALLFIDLEKNIKFDSIKRYWQKNLRDAGIKAGIVKLNSANRVISSTRLHPHMLRHSYATFLLDKDTDIKKIQVLLGHSSIQSTQIYLHVDKKKLNEEINQKMDLIQDQF